MKVHEITDQDSVAKLILKIKKAIKKKTGKKASDFLTLVLEDGKKIAFKNPKNSMTKLYTLGINRFSKLRFFDKPKEPEKPKDGAEIKIKYGDYMKFLEYEVKPED